MSFKFKKANCVALGTFNVYVVQPAFLIEIGVVKGEETRLEAALHQPGFRTVASDGSCVWTIKPDRLIVETTDPKKNCGDDVSRILDALRWTPVTAIGSNAEFISEESGYTHFFPTPPKLVQGDVLQTSVHHAVGRDGKVINLQLSKRENECEFSFNYHCDVTATETKHKKGQLAKNELARRLAAEFPRQRDEAISLAQSLFSLSVCYEQNSNDATRLNDVVVSA